MGSCGLCEAFARVAPADRALTGLMLFLARHRGLASVAFKFEKSLAPMMRLAVGKS